MKKYVKPQSQVVNLDLEGEILSSSSMGMNREEASREVLSNRKNMWGKEGIWD